VSVLTQPFKKKISQPFKKLLLTISMIAAMVVAGQNMFTSSPIAEAGAKVFEGVDAGGQKVSVQNNAKAGIFKDMNGLLILGMGISGFLCIGCLLFAGSRIAMAQTNPQARTQAIGGFVAACFGGWICYKCLVIAGWVGGFGG
jgi:hypothetical protein